MPTVDGPEFVGFYWTFPVVWAGFTSLSHDPEEAARQSRTIRYQREAVRREIDERRGTRIAEIVFLERSPDRGTEHVEGRIRKALDICRDRRATLLWVNFAEAQSWRRHPRLYEIIHESGVRQEPLTPEPLIVDGEPFDPVRHFQDWRRLDSEARAARSEIVPAALAAAMDRIPEGWGRNRKIAEFLNDLGVPTRTGRPWTDDIVRKEIAAVTSVVSPGT